MTLNNLDKKLANLANILKNHGRILVALSGGVDSTFLLAFARMVLGKDNVTAVTAAGPHLAPDEAAYAAKLCAQLNIMHSQVPMDHVMSVIKSNPPDRCYLCKKEIFSHLKVQAQLSGSVLADGTNLDDMDDYRPGHRALTELDVASPLRDAELTKHDIRTALKLLAAGRYVTGNSASATSESVGGLMSAFASDDSDVDIMSALTLSDGSPIWEKPAFACLASRIPYGEEITEQKLTAVYDAELFLRSLGFTQVRVRHHGDIARIEVPAEERHRFFDEKLMDTINEKLKGCGFRFATLDLGGYKMGGGFHDR